MSRFGLSANALLGLILVGCGGSPSPSSSPSLISTRNGSPTVTLSPAAANAFVGQTVILTWSSTDATSCTASGAWNGPLATSGSEAVTLLSAGENIYQIACSALGSSASASSTIAVTTPALSVTNDFSPNGITISTSEGGPEGSADLWLLPRGGRIVSAYGSAPSKVIVLPICLAGQVGAQDCSKQPDVTGPLSPQLLADLDSRLASFARTGERIIPSFMYNFGPTENGRDAPLDLILTHIDQLAPILLKNRDLILAMKAGFIGSWGEWHHSKNGNDTAAAHKAVIERLLSHFKGVFPVLVRYPAAIIHYADSLTPPDGLGIHDDFFASNADDGNTWRPDPFRVGEPVPYTREQLMAHGEQISTTSLFLGEFAALYPPLQNCAALDAYSHRFHLQVASFPTIGNQIGPVLESQGCVTSFINKIGTRIELQRVTLIGNSGAGQSLFVALTMVNAGYGRVMRARPATLVFLSGGNVVGQVPISLQDLDLRQLASSSPATPKTFQFTVTLPSSLPAGRPITVALVVPDPAPSLTQQAAYALPLNSLDANRREIFDSATGYNTIGTFTSGAMNQGNNFVLRPLYTAAPSLELTGNWSGESAPGAESNTFTPMQMLPSRVRDAVARLQGTPRITWSLQQRGTTITGTASVTLQGATLLTGTLNGTFANGALAYIVSVPTGGASVAPECAGQIEGLASLTATALAGSAAIRTSTCALPRPSVTFTLTKQR
jgi:Domain of unknown function (DUF4874)/Domain of unknown function (DUF4832)